MRSCFSASTTGLADSSELLIRAVDVSKVHHCCICGHLLNRRQSVLNAEWLVFSATWSEHTRPLLRHLHCLRVPVSSVYSDVPRLNGTALSYLAESISQVADVEGSRHLRLSATISLIVPPVRRTTLASDHFREARGTAFHLPPEPHRLLSLFDENWKHFSTSQALTATDFSVHFSVHRTVSVMRLVLWVLFSYSILNFFLVRK